MVQRHLFLLLLFLAFNTQAQIQGGGGKGHYFPENGWEKVPLISFPSPDIVALRQEDRVLDSLGDHPWRFGYNHSTFVNSAQNGVWMPTKNHGKLWLLRIKSSDALTLNLAFDHTVIPKGNELYIYNPDKTFILGKFTEEHLYEEQLGSELVPGDEIILEYYVPEGNPKGHVQLSTVTHGYRTPQEFYLKAFGSSGNCNFNVNCPQGAAWQQERNGVVMLVTNNNGFCSGSLINNTLNNGKPYVLTANHCFSNPANWVFRFNWQSAGCNNPATEPTFQSLNSGILRARASSSDFCLVEITGGLQGGTVPAAFNPYFNGWDNTNNIPTSAVGIHHPAGDIKKISIENNPLISTTFGASPANSHWGVTGWDEGVTEGGSSGSPLFDQNHRIVGQLHGGASACGAAALSDEYGKISYSWNPQNSDSSNQLKYWLDPAATNATFVNGYDPSGNVPAQVDPALSATAGVSGTFCNGTITPSVTLSNGGALTLTTVTINYGFDGQNNLSYTWNGSLAQWQSTTITLPAANLGSGTHTFTATVNNPNTGNDENINNNTQNNTFTVVINGQAVLLDLTLDCYGSETSWELTDQAGTVLFSGSGYPDNAPGLISETWCLNAGCYIFTINDSYGDGIYGLPWCDSSGNVIISAQGDSLTGISSEASDFGDQAQLNFCIEENSLQGLENIQINLYPNPGKTIIYGVASSNLTKINLLDLQGKIVKTEYYSPTKNFSLDVTDLKSGIYWLHCTLENGYQSVINLMKD